MTITLVVINLATKVHRENWEVSSTQKNFYLKNLFTSLCGEKILDIGLEDLPCDIVTVS